MDPCEHKDHLFNSYFPEIGCQVFLFSESPNMNLGIQCIFRNNGGLTRSVDIGRQPSMELERHAAKGGLQGPCVPAEDRKVSKMSSKFKRPTPRPSASALKKQLPAQFASGGRLSAGATPGDGRQSIQSDAATPVFSPFTHAAMSALAGSSLGATPTEPPPTAARLVAAPGSGQVTVSKVEREAPAAATSTDDHGGAAAAGFAAAQTKATTAGRCRQN